MVISNSFFRIAKTHKWLFQNRCFTMLIYRSSEQVLWFKVGATRAESKRGCVRSEWWSCVCGCVCLCVFAVVCMCVLCVPSVFNVHTHSKLGSVEHKIGA
jgi:hypothetical protein